MQEGKWHNQETKDGSRFNLFCRGKYVGQIHKRIHARDIVTACNSYAQQQKVIKGLVGACEAAMRISELWRVDPEINLENPSEGQVLDEMMQGFEAALTTAQELK